MEIHHIKPKHEFKKHEKGLDIPSNRLLVTVPEHVIAHWIRWRVLNNTKDKRSVLLRIGETEEAYRLKLKHIKEALTD